MWTYTLLILGAYIFGSVPHLPLLAKLRHVELDGDYHQGLWRKAGKVTGVLGVLGEFIKGITPVLVGKALGFNTAIIAAAGLAAVIGQMWPVFSKFDGEKGNSIGLAMVMALAPIPGLIALIPLFIALLIRTAPRLIAKGRSGGEKPLIGGQYSRSLPLGMAMCFLILPLIAWCRGEPRETVWCFGALFILIMIRRLTAGLGNDLKAKGDIKGVLIRRLLYDRATVEWRQE
jgi:glycerol-3-phosphate acyltransferase PlsY